MVKRLTVGSTMRNNRSEEICTSRHLFKCTKCNYVWKRVYSGPHKTSIQEKYKDFPAYGLKQKTCKECYENFNFRNNVGQLVS